MIRALICLSAAVLCTGALAAPVEVSPRPAPRPLTPGATAVSADKAAGFRDWQRSFTARAVAQGRSAETIAAAFRTIAYDPKVVERDRNQSEFTKTIWDYLDTAVSDLRVSNGIAALDRHRTLLEGIEARYGVPKEIVTAIWGLESAYGTFKGSDNVVQSLATLAYDGRRGDFFEAQLIAALKILESGDVTPAAMRGSWAGAMGHTQFMPTSFLDVAVDYTGDGKRDIWGEDPADALASTAAYLAKAGWRTGAPWGLEVVLPEGFDHRLSGMDKKQSPEAWAALGLRSATGVPLPDAGPAALLLPGGHRGAAILAYRNFNVLERYNSADAYVIAVGHLADRIVGAAPFQAAWPRDLRALSRDERLDLQRRLTAAGFDTQGVDGRIGPNTIAAIQAFQASVGAVPDGFASTDVLRRLP